MKRSFDVAGGSSAPSGSASAGPSGSGQEGQRKRRRPGLETPEKVREYREGKEQSQAMRNVHAWYAQEERRKAQLYRKRKDEEELRRKNEERQRMIEEASLVATRLAHEQTVVLTNRFIDRMSQGASFEEARNQLGTDIEERSEELRRSIQESLNQSFPPEQVEVVPSPDSSPPGSPIRPPTPPIQPPQSPAPAAPQSPAPAAPQSPAPAAPQSPAPAAPQSPAPAAPQSPAPAAPQPPAPAAQSVAVIQPPRRRPGNPGRRSTRLAMLTEASLSFLKVGPYIDRLRIRPLRSSYYPA